MWTSAILGEEPTITHNTGGLRQRGLASLVSPYTYTEKRSGRAALEIEALFFFCKISLAEVELEIDL